MESRFHRELDQLKLTIVQMAALAEKAMSKAITALQTRNIELAEEVIKKDQEINLLEIQIDQNILKLLALAQPMARDLRFLVGCQRISLDLERIGDQAVNIAHRTHYLSTRPPLPYDPAMEQLGETALEMLGLVLSSFVNLDADQAMEVCQMDDAADELNVEVLKNCLDYMTNETPAIKRAMRTIIVARCLERVADHCTNIAESIVFIVKGVNIKHHCDQT